MALINPKISSLAAHFVLYGLLGFMYHTNQVFVELNTEIREFIDKTYSLFFNIYDNMARINTECNYCYDLLEEIKPILLCAKEEQSFQNVNVDEMKKNCQALLFTFQSLSDLNRKTSNMGFVFKKTLLDLKKQFNKSRNLYKFKYNIVGALAGGFFTGSATDSILLFGLGISAGMGVTTLGMYCTSYEKNCIELVIKKLHNDTFNISERADETRLKMEIAVHCLQEQFESANRNDKNKFGLGARVTLQVNKMLKDIFSVQNELLKIKRDTQLNTVDIKKMMELGNVADLLNL